MTGKTTLLKVDWYGSVDSWSGLSIWTLVHKKNASTGIRGKLNETFKGKILHSRRLRAQNWPPRVKNCFDWWFRTTYPQQILSKQFWNNIHVISNKDKGIFKVASLAPNSYCSHVERAMFDSHTLVCITSSLFFVWRGVMGWCIIVIL